MTQDDNGTERLPALEKLQGEFVRVARSGVRPRRRPSMLRLGVALAGVLLVVPAAMAVGGTDLFDDPDPDVPPGTPPGVEVLTHDEAVERGLIPEGSEDEADEVDFASEGPGAGPDRLLRECRKDPQSARLEPLHCEALIAIEEGRLAPGQYEDEELRELLGK